MFEVPSDETVERIVITEACVLGKDKPLITHNPDRQPISRPKKKKAQTRTVSVS